MKIKTQDELIERTIKGCDVAEEIQGETAYGHSGDLNAADLWNIVDNLHTHFLDNGNPS